jgi:antitoxin component of MazEF toxin-antitoxin module
MEEKQHFGKAIRKIIQIGECDGITIPRKYLETNNLKRGDSVELFFNNIIRVQPLRDDDIRKQLGGEAST